MSLLQAVVKAISSLNPDSRKLWTGPSGVLIGIEVLSANSGAPVVVLTGHALEVSQALGIKEVKVSISHAGDVAVAQAMAE
jgi:phosphopantetheinyl transferase (holo-ACP synthase)